MRLTILFASLLFALSKAQTAGNFCEDVTYCDNASFCNYENGASGICIACEDIPAPSTPNGSGCEETQVTAAVTPCQRKCEFALEATATSVSDVDYLPGDGGFIEDFNFICSFVGNPLGSACPARSTSCVDYYCTEAENNCFGQHKEYGTPCESTRNDINGLETQVP